MRALNLLLALSALTLTGAARTALMLYLTPVYAPLLAWAWLRQTTVAQRALEAGAATPADEAFYRGKLQAGQWFFRWELPKVAQQLALLRSLDDSTLTMQDGWF